MIDFIKTGEYPAEQKEDALKKMGSLKKDLQGLASYL
jgi:hypothetical protein